MLGSRKNKNKKPTPPDTLASLQITTEPGDDNALQVQIGDQVLVRRLSDNTAEVTIGGDLVINLKTGNKGKFRVADLDMSASQAIQPPQLLAAQTNKARIIKPATAFGIDGADAFAKAANHQPEPDQLQEQEITTLSPNKHITEAVIIEADTLADNDNKNSTSDGSTDNISSFVNLGDVKEVQTRPSPHRKFLNFKGFGSKSKNSGQSGGKNQVQAVEVVDDDATPLIPVATQMPQEILDEWGQPLLWTNRPLELADLYQQGYFSDRARLALCEVQGALETAGLPPLTPINCVESADSLHLNFKGSPQAIALYASKNKPLPVSLVSNLTKSPLEAALKDATGAAITRLEVGAGGSSNSLTVYLGQIDSEHTYQPVGTTLQVMTATKIPTFFTAGAIRTYSPFNATATTTEAQPVTTSQQQVELGYFHLCLETVGNVLFVASRGDEAARNALASSVVSVSVSKLISRYSNKSIDFQVCLVEPPTTLGNTPDQIEQTLEREMAELGVEDADLRLVLSREIESGWNTLKALVNLPDVTALVEASSEKSSDQWKSQLRELTDWLLSLLISRRNNQDKKASANQPQQPQQSILLVLEDLTAALDVCGDDLHQILAEGPQHGIYTFAATTYEAIGTSSVNVSDLLSHFGTLGVFAALDEQASIKIWGNNAACRELSGYGDMFLRTAANQQLRLGGFKSHPRQIEELTSMLSPKNERSEAK